MSRIQQEQKDVLIVDDDDAIRSLLHGAVTRGALTCDVAVDGVEALEMLDRHQYGVLLLDLMMPRLSGMDVLEQMTAKTDEELPVVFVMTAVPEREPLLAHWDKVHAVLKKPFDVPALVDIVRGCATARRDHETRISAGG